MCKAIGAVRLAVLDLVRRATGSATVDINGTGSGGAKCTLGGGSCVGCFGSTLGDDWGNTGKSGVTRVSSRTLGDQRDGIAGGIAGAGGSSFGMHRAR